MEEYEHINKDFKSLLSLNNEERICKLNDHIWINYPKTKEVISLLNDLINRPKKPRMQNLLIVGESNNGKTSLVNQFSESHPDSTFEGDDGVFQSMKPVVVVQFPASADEKGLYISILECFWVPFRPTDTTAKLRYQSIHLLRSCNVKMLILDEIHNLHFHLSVH
jgi:hypothetical protein